MPAPVGPGRATRALGRETGYKSKTLYAFRAVVVPQGQSRVEFSYWPSGLTSGLWSSGVSALIVLGLAVARKRSARGTTNTSWPERRRATSEPRAWLRVRASGTTRTRTRGLP